MSKINMKSFVIAAAIIATFAALFMCGIGTAV